VQNYFLKKRLVKEHLYYICCNNFDVSTSKMTAFFTHFKTNQSIMNAFLSLGRWFFALPFAIFGLFHFMNAQAMADYVVPSYMPAKAVWVYLSGAGLIGAAVAIATGKYDKLATTLLAVFLILLVVMVHLQGAMSGTEGSQASMSMLLKDLSLAGASMLYALHLSKDRSVIG
jgi:putative oxidoreductase